MTNFNSSLVDLIACVGHHIAYNDASKTPDQFLSDLGENGRFAISRNYSTAERDSTHYFDVSFTFVNYPDIMGAENIATLVWVDAADNMVYAIELISDISSPDWRIGFFHCAEMKEEEISTLWESDIAPRHEVLKRYFGEKHASACCIAFHSSI